MSSKYHTSLMSHTTYTPDIIDLVFRLPTIRQLAFPAKLPTEEGFTEIDSPESFNLSLQAKHFIGEISIRIPLISDEGIHFSINISTMDQPTPSVIVIKYSEKGDFHKIISVDFLALLIGELDPIFRLSYGRLWDSQIIQHRPNLIYYRGPNKKSFPMDIGWASFFGKDLVDFIGREQFETLKSASEIRELEGGFMLVSTPEPFQAERADHREREAAIIAELGLQRFVP